ncbi:MAG: CDP-alcohol phosphatidyltransferase family protein [Patescibacteria group bacterium]
MNGIETVGRAAANGMPVMRAVLGPVFADQLVETPPEDRTWKEAGKVAFVAATDKVDGFISGLIGPTALGASLDDLGDKLFVIPQYRALAANGEIPSLHYKLKIARDLAVTGMRGLAASKGKDVKARPLGKQKTVVDMLTLVAAHSPMAENEDILRAGLSISTALSIASFADYAMTFAKSDSPTKPTDNARNGAARKAFANPVDKLVGILDSKAPNVTPDHLTLMGELMVDSSVALAVAKPDKVFVTTALFTAGSLLDGVDGALARAKGQANGGTTIKGMLKDVRADKRQEILTFFGLSLIARKRGNNVAANNYAVAAMTTVLSALYRASAESQGYIVPEDGAGTRVMRAVLGGAGLALNKNQEASDIISGLVATGNINTSKERRHVAKYGQASPYCMGVKNDRKFMEHAKIRHEALVPLAALGILLGSVALKYNPDVEQASDLAV